ncbi:MAG: PD-(D/E)XK nuclease family protein, partial [Phototrophicales bacterium]
MLPPNFQFSQSNLQDYIDCPRRFELRHIQHLHYPSIESEPQLDREAHQRRGVAFHR